MITVEIFKKSANLVWRYKALWLFGFLLALTVNNITILPWLLRNEEIVFQNRLILSNTTTIYLPGEGMTIDLHSPGEPRITFEGLEPDWYRELSPFAHPSDVSALLISFAILIVVCIVLRILFRYTSMAGLIRMVDENERSEAMVSVFRGLRLSWSRVAVKLFLINLFIDVIVILAFIVLYALAIAPFFLFALEGVAGNLAFLIGINIIGVICLLIVTILAFAVGIILSITRPVMAQACAVDGLGIWASIRQGFSLLKTRFSKVIVTWLVWWAIRLGWMIVIIPVVLILAPLLLITVLIGAVIFAVPTLVVFAIASQFVNPVFAWIMGAIWALPIFVMVSVSPLFFLSGLVEVLKSSFWTLSYREFRPLAESFEE